MRLIGFAGWSGAGKTTLIVKLIPELNRRGLSVSTIKHAHHNFDLDQPGKDSYEHRAAGAAEVLVASANRVALMRELRGAPEPSLPELLRLLKPVDLVLIEGFKRDPVPKIEIFRLANGKPPMYPEDPHIVALISDLEQRAIERSRHREEPQGVERRPSFRTGYGDEAIEGNVGRPTALDRHVGRRPPRDDDSTRKHLPSVGPEGSLPHASIDDIAAAADLVLAHAKPVAAVLAAF
jgi:molybdopterin-guanine dinucleotide biosynthesis adapter protein